MADRRLIDDGATPLERALLESARGDAPSAAARARIAATLASAAPVAPAATAVPVGAWLAAAGVAGLAVGALVLKLGGSDGARRSAARPEPAVGSAPVVARAPAPIAAPTPAMPSGPAPAPVTAVRDEPPPRARRTIARVDDSPIDPTSAPIDPPIASIDPPIDPQLAPIAPPSAPIDPQPAIAPPSAPIAPPSPAPTAPSSPGLTEELALLGRAQASLTAADGRAALATLDRYRARFPHGALIQEADILAIEAHLAIGDRPLAGQLARRFLAAYPNSALSRRARSLADRARP